MGLTCDDAHTILLDQIYDEDELFKQNKSNQQNITQQNNIDSSLLNQNTSYSWESSKENQHFANTLPYQTPKVSDINIQKSNISESLTRFLFSILYVYKS